MNHLNALVSTCLLPSSFKFWYLVGRRVVALLIGVCDHEFVYLSPTIIMFDMAYTTVEEEL